MLASVERRFLMEENGVQSIKNDAVYFLRDCTFLG